MGTKLISAIRMIAYMLRFGKRISFKGIPKISKNVDIKITQGKMVVGKSFTANAGAYFAVVTNGQLSIKDNVYFGRNCMAVCQDSICIGSNVAIGPNVFLYDHDHAFGIEGVKKGFRTAPISIGNNCWIGAGTIILRGTNIGDGCIIGAGCVVKGNIPPHSLVTSGRELNIVPLVEKRK